MADLEQLSLGTVYDMFTERGNDREEYDTVADQGDMDAF